MSQQDPNRPPTVRIDMRMLIPMFGILFAPFIGFLLDANLGLAILVVCLSVVAWMTWHLAAQAPRPQARTLKMGAVMNGAMAIAALLLLLVRL